MTASLGANSTIDSAVDLTMPNIKSRGSYLIKIESDADGGATAIFSLSKASAGDVGSVYRITTAHGTDLEELDMRWAANENPKFFHNPIRQTGTLDESLSYTVSLV